MWHAINITASTIASSLRLWRGTGSSSKDIKLEKELILFDREGCPSCRIVREAITALNLDVTIMPCPIGGKNIKQLKRESGDDELPKLYDANTETSHKGVSAIIDYLYREYRGQDAPKKYHEQAANLLLSKLSSLSRFNAGTRARPARMAKEPLTLYSFESSPYSRPVRERLCELELPYHLVNLGKQQWSDMGPANARFTLKAYKPLPGTKREAFFLEHGNVQVPYLIDPNTGARLFESREILSYLDKTYTR